jgi:hypothetical protein
MQQSGSAGTDPSFTMQESERRVQATCWNLNPGVSVVAHFAGTNRKGVVMAVDSVTQKLRVKYFGQHQDRH